MATINEQYTTTFADQVDTYQAALKSLFSGKPEDTESDLSRLFAPTFTQRDDDATRDFAAFVAHIRWQREILPPGSANDLTVTHFLRDGNQLAERHSGSKKKAGGTETFQFAEIAEDGRIAWIVETVKKYEE